MLSDLKKILYLLPVVVALLFASYIYFNRYQPKSIRQVEEVKGKHVGSKEEEITYPLGAKNVSYNDTSSKIQATFQTNKTPEEIMSFYKAVLMDKDWELDSEGDENGFYISYYRKDSQRIKILASFQSSDEETLVSVEKY
ncbi:hypothetical protein A3K34_03630 [candidate division WWE3 bacterium RIFOXYC1_FULL_40_10]|uniref:Uncharacterized protein n=1 Tax=candidate division WWE3 bacterium RIFOXYA2_FULL_46_9 TaxID=1802636 RepID=A0A1F4VYX6_UNCKA|nr:MAG: hypothetical protein A3K58_03630 [candidate division WWE3 bacterium RIFOXYB1_FULL_40_22]OGC61934.1 MAG: hypothetical protein A3K37_03630 [candidate division WWE3 bacterium RIFOXYA1_FULL_40_11]OGC62300.1 MAG: hypothetical protein A2264_03385 [candidate division WWE3 bacterium RIFOXYA2_FULL_46_9]OGC64491.1 MAG: hypothetical protein A2326_03770 [candidate division WWE3 bacterium RIFOXYB2_FULL_41_6]OGC66317.1 MAG: hypothetical protein A3K34_03630 [candidate division WWE3 bacterium RIFOXYC1_